MAKPLDTRIIAAAKVVAIHLTPNLTLPNPDPESSDPYWCQMASIDYSLHDADGNVLGQRALTHQTAGVDVKPTLAQAIQTVGAQLRTWIGEDRVLIADNDAD